MAPPETKLPVAEIVRRFEEGETAVDLAKEYGCGYSTLQKAIYYFRNAAIVLTPPVVHDESTGYYLDAAGHRFTRAELLRYMSAVRERERIERAARSSRSASKKSLARLRSVGRNAHSAENWRAPPDSEPAVPTLRSGCRQSGRLRVRATRVSAEVPVPRRASSCWRTG